MRGRAIEAQRYASFQVVVKRTWRMYDQRKSKPPQYRQSLHGIVLRQQYVLVFGMLHLLLAWAVIIALSPEPLRQSKVFGLVPLILIVVLNVGAMLVASIRASRRVMGHRADDA
jgi:hypothetical protein